MSSPPTIYKKLRDASKSAGPGRPIPETTWNSIWKASKRQWFGWIITNLSKVGADTKKPLMLVTFTMRFLGMTRLAQKILSDLGMLSTLRYTDTQQALLDQQYSSTLK